MEDFSIKNKKTGLRISECPEYNKLSKRKCYYKHFEKNKDKFHERNKIIRKNRNNYIKNAKSDGCIICGEKDVSCLDFHHIKDKIYNISTIKAALSIDKVENEIKKCVVLCANCHRKLHFYNLTIDELKEKYSSEIK